MAAQFKTSFIPKKTFGKSMIDKNVTVGPSAGRSMKKSGPSVNLFLAGSVFIFFVSMIVAGGLFAYQYFIQQDILAKSKELEQAEQSIDLKLVSELKRLDARIAEANTLLANHRALTPFLDFLEAHTLRSVSYDSFQYSHGGERDQVILKGVADDYMSVALLSDVLSESDVVETAVFSGLQINDSGTVNFSATLEVSGSIFSYDQIVQDGNANINPISSL